jgi:hypothetical protein
MAIITRKMGMLVDKSNLGFGLRSWRYSMFVSAGLLSGRWRIALALLANLVCLILVRRNREGACTCAPR